MDTQRAQPNNRGKLKIYFGYSFGTGTTYAMLDDAYLQLQAGRDVVIGFLQPYSYAETIRKAAPFEKIPFLKIPPEGNGTASYEFNLDAAIRRRPQLILVDEMAHSNARVKRHRKRWQDIEELLFAGIDVYTTVNVQNLESLNDIVAAITGVEVLETVPDFMFDEAGQVELIDIEPDVLLQRFQDGAIYVTPQYDSAPQAFFTKENLVALREVALRRCADRISKLQIFQWSDKDERRMTLGEALVVCLSFSPSNGHVIRAASRIAEAFHADWTALYVETTGRWRLTAEEQSRLKENMALAERLGARVVTVRGKDIADQVVLYARARNVSRVVIGKNHRKASRHKWLAVDIADKIIAASPYIDVYVIPEQDYKKPRGRFPAGSLKLSPSDLGLVLLTLAAATGLSLLLKNVVSHEANFAMIYLMGVLLVSNRTRGQLPGILCSILSVLAFNFFFSAPYFAFTSLYSSSALTFAVMLFAAFLTNTLTSRIRTQREIAAERDHTNDLLLQTSRVLMRAHDRMGLSQIIADHLVRLVERPAVCYIPEDPYDTALPEAAFSSADKKTEVPALAEKQERIAAEWVLKNAKEAGNGTNTHPDSRGYYFPILGENGTIAVVGILCDPPLPKEKQQILWTVAGQIALAVERETLENEQRKAQREIEREQLRSNLLHAVSHDLRTPLAGIAGAANAVLENEDRLDPKERRELLSGICQDADWLIQIVENLLSVTRIDEGRLKLNMKEEMIEEIVAESIERVEKRLDHHRLQTKIDQPTATAFMDGKLIEQVLINLMDNAIRYTPDGTTIRLKAWCDGDKVNFEVEDDGDGLCEEDIPYLFDRYFTKGESRKDTRKGIGLGLSIARSIVRAHGGEIAAFNARPHGAVFRFWLPLTAAREKQYE